MWRGGGEREWRAGAWREGRWWGARSGNGERGEGSRGISDRQAKMALGFRSVTGRGRRAWRAAALRAGVCILCLRRVPSRAESCRTPQSTDFSVASTSRLPHLPHAVAIQRRKRAGEGSVEQRHVLVGTALKGRTAACRGAREKLGSTQNLGVDLQTHHHPPEPAALAANDAGAQAGRHGVRASV